MENKGEYRYPGSRPFEDTDIDRKLFFGREQEKDDLLQKIIARKLVVLHAESGLGKTSLLNAGVSQLLRNRGFLPLRIRFNRSETRPIQTIFNDIKETAERQHLDFESGETVTLWHYFKTAAFWSPDDTLLTPVLILDQFEEFFAFHEPEARNEFIMQLADLLHNTIPSALRQAIRAGGLYRYGDDPPRVKMVISIRSDFMGQLDELSATVPEILDNRHRLLALTRMQAREAIIKPSQIEDEQMLTQRFRYSEDALNTMLDYLSKRRERGGVVNKDEVESFQLQLLCRHIETNILEKAGTEGNQDEFEIKKEDLGGEAGMHKVFQHFYEHRLAELKPPLNKRRVRRLCEKGLISDWDRRLSLEEEVIETQFKVSPALLAQLVDSRLLRSEKRVGSVYYELSHDTLITPIRLCQRKHMILSRRKPMDALFNKAEGYAFDERPDQARRIYNKILKEDPKNTMAIVKLGELLSVGRKYETAVQLYKKAITNGVTVPRVYAELGRLLFKTGKKEEAIKCINEAIAINPRQTDAYEALGDHYSDKKEFKIAIDNYEKVLAIDNKCKGVYEKLAVLYVEKGEKEKAFEIFKRALTVDAELVEIYEEIRDVLKQKNDTKTLESLYEIALKVESKDANHYYWLGEDFSGVKNYDAAIASYKKALKLSPDDDYVYTNMGNAQFNKGDYDAAIASYQKSQDLNPDFASDFAEAYYNMGDAQITKGDYDGAIASYRKALEIKPTDLLAKENLAELYLITERFDKAMELAHQVLKEKGVPQYRIFAMRSIVISSMFFQGNQPQALMELQQLIMVYQGLTKNFKQKWDYGSIKKDITQIQRLNEPTRALLLKMIDLLEAPKKEGDKILVELETMAGEYEKIEGERVRR